VAAGLEDEQVEPAAVRHHPAMGGRAGHDDVVAPGQGQRAEHRLEHAGAGLDVRQLVAHGVAPQPARPIGGHPRDGHVVVPEEELAALDGVPADGQLPGPQVARQQRVVGHERRLPERHGLSPHQRRR
jgi:hypothetical protein